MSSITIETMEGPAARSEGGITLLEAYSALASRESKRIPAVEIPFPGQPSGVDREGHFWMMKLRNVG
ncbi:MAG: hypothetical protein JNK74_24990 [Candidatus Hydrogenedentes bacterium]|nr:hypothetical protein [Candidatus Hydrogenedentota bacterium]